MANDHGNERQVEVSAPHRGQTVEATLVPRVLVGTVNGVEALAIGVLQLARNVLLTTVSGTIDLGASLVGASAAAARGTVGVAARLVGETATVAQTTLQSTFAGARDIGTEVGQALRRVQPGPRVGGRAPGTASSAGGPRRVRAAGMKGRRDRQSLRKTEATVHTAA